MDKKSYKSHQILQIKHLDDLELFEEFLRVERV